MRGVGQMAACMAAWRADNTLFLLQVINVKHRPKSLTTVKGFRGEAKEYRIENLISVSTAHTYT